MGKVNKASMLSRGEAPIITSWLNTRPSTVMFNQYGFGVVVVGLMPLKRPQVLSRAQFRKDKLKSVRASVVQTPKNRQQAAQQRPAVDNSVLGAPINFKMDNSEASASAEWRERRPTSGTAVAGDL